MMEIMVLIRLKNWVNKFMGGTIYVLAGKCTGKFNIMFCITPTLIFLGMMKILMRGE
jgi:hypothetical protein